MKQRFVPLFGALFIVAPVVYLGACHIPNLKDINLSECMASCNQQAKTACKDLGGSGPCFDDIDTCFHGAADCSDACQDCETKGTCVDEDGCNHDCVHQARGCTDLIHPCIDKVQEELETNLTDGCIGPLLDCINTCIADVEATLKG